MSAFDRAAGKHAAAVHAATAERVLWQPQAPPGDATAGGPDPDLPEVEVRLTVTRRPRVVEREGEGANSADNARLVSAKWRVSYPEAAPVHLRAGDHVERLDVPGRPVLVVFEPLSIRGRIIHPADPVS